MQVERRQWPRLLQGVDDTGDCTGVRIADEPHGEVHQSWRDPGDPRAGSERARLRLELSRERLRGGDNRRREINRDEQSHERANAPGTSSTVSIRRTISSAACDAWNFTWS